MAAVPVDAVLYDAKLDGSCCSAEVDVRMLNSDSAGDNPPRGADVDPTQAQPLAPTRAKTAWVPMQVGKLEGLVSLAHVDASDEGEETRLRRPEPGHGHAHATKPELTVPRSPIDVPHPVSPEVRRRGLRR